MKNKYPAIVYEILTKLKTNGARAYLCGGSIRDNLLGKNTTDFDFSTSLLPDEIISIFSGYTLETYAKKYGTISIKHGNCRFEITTFRHDDDYIENRHPQIIEFIDNALDDSWRRDFSINALYYNGVALIDFHDGLKDIEDKVIRTIGDPSHSFRQDALRMLRAIRFAGELNFSIEASTMKALIDNIYLLSTMPLRYLEKEIIKIAIQNNFNHVYNHIICKCVSNAHLIDTYQIYSFKDRITLLAKALNLNMNDLEYCYNINKRLKGVTNENY